VSHVDENTDREVEVLQAAYGSLGYTISRLPNGSLRAFHAASKYTSDADSTGGLRKSIIERETGTGIHGSPGGVSGK
jgi:hypothetical protein